MEQKKTTKKQQQTKWKQNHPPEKGNDGEFFLFKFSVIPDHSKESIYLDR